jgi:hypothetical protein
VGPGSGTLKGRDGANTTRRPVPPAPSRTFSAAPRLRPIPGLRVAGPGLSHVAPLGHKTGATRLVGNGQSLLPLSLRQPADGSGGFHGRPWQQSGSRLPAVQGPPAGPDCTAVPGLRAACCRFPSVSLLTGRGSPRQAVATKRQQAARSPRPAGRPGLRGSPRGPPPACWPVLTARPVA